MKLCPQCDFIYEDDQRFCDMDGKELVHNPAPGIPASVEDPSPASKPATGRRSIGLAFALIIGVVVTALGSAAYFARTEQTGSGAASSNQATEQSVAQSPAQSTSGATGAQPPAADSSATQTSAANSGLLEQSTEQSVEQSPEPSSAQTDPSSPASTSSSSRASPAHTRLTAGPVSAGAPGGNSRGPVIVRLNNGAAIKADESWERKEGIWYRQADVVTFLKRSRVRTIERPATTPAPSQSARNNIREKNQKTENAAAGNQLRLAQLEPVDTKKQSRVASFLKKTGRILKRPFKF